MLLQFSGPQQDLAESLLFFLGPIGELVDIVLRQIWFLSRLINIIMLTFEVEAVTFRQSPHSSLVSPPVVLRNCC